MQIEIINGGDLCREVFTFRFDTGLWGIQTFRFDLELFSRQTRPTKRHKWIIRQFYTRFSSRDSSLKFEDVPITSNEIQNAKEQIVALVRQMELSNIK